MKIVVAESKSDKFQNLQRSPRNKCVVQIVSSIKSEMNCNFLAKKIRMWFNQSAKHDEKDFTFRFRGKESLSYMKHFPDLILMLLNHFTSANHAVSKKLLIFHLQSKSLRIVLSLAVGIESFTKNDLEELKKEAKFLFKITCLYDTSISPSLCTLCHCVPYYAEKTLIVYGLGLGVNTMEGREQKHQMLSKYSHNTTQQCRWPRIFRHEFIQLINLRENGYDVLKYRKRGTHYISENCDLKCDACGLKLNCTKCPLCDCDVMKSIISDISSI